MKANRRFARIERPVEKRPIPGFEGRYSITRDGRIWSHAAIVRNGCGYRHKKGKWLSTNNRAGSGYRMLRLGADSKQHYVHHLVMAAWGSPKPDGHYQINHIDGDRLNNRITNLEWATPKQNSRHSRALGLAQQDGEAGYHAKLTEADVLAIRRRYADGESIASLARAFSIVSQGTIFKIVHRKRWKHI